VSASACLQKHRLAKACKYVHWLLFNSSWSSFRQGCQMVYIFSYQKNIWAYFGWPWSGIFWYFLPFGTFYGHFIYIPISWIFGTFWYISSRCGILNQENTGNLVFYYLWTNCKQLLIGGYCMFHVAKWPKLTLPNLMPPNLINAKLANIIY
jgi:hypothetical protein